LPYSLGQDSMIKNRMSTAIFFPSKLGETQKIRFNNTSIIVFSIVSYNKYLKQINV